MSLFEHAVRVVCIIQLSRGGTVSHVQISKSLIINVLQTPAFLGDTDGMNGAIWRSALGGLESVSSFPKSPGER